MPAALTILLVLFGVIVAIGLAVVLLIYVVVPMFKVFGWLVAHIFRFIGGEIGDLFRLIGSVITGLVLVPMVLFNIVIGRWSASGHFGRAVQNELLTAGACVYRIFIGHPAHLLGLRNVTEGIEHRLPQVVAQAPGSDKPSRQTGTFEGYTIIGSLKGGGSGGRLYIAEPDHIRLASFARSGQHEVDRVVIKSFNINDGSSLPQIIRESRALESAKKLGLVLDHELTDERFHYVMRYVPGDSLGIATGNMHGASGIGGLDDGSLRDALSYTGDLLRTLDVYHRGGLWHKDVKPDNIIVHDGRAHLVDLGLVTPMRSAMTLTTHGTEYFRDPELVRQALKGVKVHQVDGAKFDVYAAGAVLYSMIENSFPAHGGLSQVTKRCPEALRWVIRRSMTDYDKRYGSAQEMLDDLEAIRVAADPFGVKPAMLPSMGGGSDAEDDAEAAERPDNPAFDAIWARICASAGQDLRTRDGEAFTFKADEKAAHPSVVDYPIARASFERAFELGPNASGDDLSRRIRGGSYVWAIMHDERVGAFPPMPRTPEPVAVASAATPVPPKTRTRPKLKVTNWWSGAYEKSGEERVEVAPRRPSRAVPTPPPVPPAEALGATPRAHHVRPVAMRAPAQDQLRSARARAAAARERAHARIGSRRKRLHATDPTKVNAGVAFVVFLFLATCLAFVGVFVGGGVFNSHKQELVQAAPGITIDEQIDGALLTDENGAVVGINFEAVGRELGMSVPQARAVASDWLNEIRQSPQAIKMAQHSSAAPVVTIDDQGRPVVGESTAAVQLTDARLLFVSDFRPPLDKQTRSAYEEGLSTLANAGVTLVGDVPGEFGDDQIELMAQAERARGQQPLDSSEVAGDLMDWLVQTESADLILWIEPAPIGETLDNPCARYLIVGESGMLRGSVNDCAALPEVFTRTLRAAIDWD